MSYSYVYPQRANQHKKEASLKQMRQRALFRTLGQLYRTKANLEDCKIKLYQLKIDTKKFDSINSQLIIELDRKIAQVKEELYWMKTVNTIQYEDIHRGHK